jgi:hypothetical protein
LILGQYNTDSVPKAFPEAFRGVDFAGLTAKNAAASSGTAVFARYR